MNPYEMMIPEKIKDERARVIREVFRNKIKINFLLKVTDIIRERIGVEILKYYDMRFDNTNLISGTVQAPDYDICRMIIGAHRSHSIFLTKEQISANEKKDAYKNMIAEEVLEKIRIRQYASVYFSPRSLCANDEFLYFPVPYELFALCIYSDDLHKDIEDDDIAGICASILTNTASALILLENGLTNNAYPLCRSVIESYVKFIMLKNHPEAIEAYNALWDCEVEHSYCRNDDYSEAFFEMYNNRKDKTAKNKSDFLHYGWVDSINGYKHSDKNKDKPYSLYEVVNNIINNSKSERQNEELEKLIGFYKGCHGYSHGSAVFHTYQLLPYFEISLMLYYPMKYLFEYLCNETKVDRTINGQDIISMLERDISILRNQYEERSVDKFDLYYQCWKN